MIVNEDRRTSPKQRIIIAAIAVFMLASTFALYVGIVLNYQNGGNQSANANNRLSKFSELYNDYQNRKADQADELSAKYFEQFKGYRSETKAFNAAAATELKTRDIVVGEGREITYEYEDEETVSSYDTDYAAYYIGWLSDETIFDSSFNSKDDPTALSSPLNGSTNMIQGWLEGIEGMRIGGVREITIPSVLGYGDQAQNDIPANSPLKFIVMLIEKPAALEVSDELESLYNEFMGTSLRAQQ